MKISFWLYCSDLKISFDFYEKVFNVENVTLNNNKTFFVSLDSHAELKISTLQKPCNEQNIEINEAPVNDLYDTFIKNNLSQSEEFDVANMPAGTFSGPWDFPGGIALFLKDPNNHCIIFTEW